MKKEGILNNAAKQAGEKYEKEAYHILEVLDLGYQDAFVTSFIFSHDFAKAFWGEKGNIQGVNTAKNYWKYHLQQMVLEEDPISYLEKHL